MKIFISHSSANKQYGDLLVELLRGIGIKEDEIVYTSNPAYGIPLSQNIFRWLKTQITEKPFVIYLLSAEYYDSIACLNEMGAAWIIENEHAIIFIPGFEIGSKEFQNGAIDPREIGFYLDDQERLLTFIHLLQEHFTISKNQVIIHQQLTAFLKKITEINKVTTTTNTVIEKPNDSIMAALYNKSQENIKTVTSTIPQPKSPEKNTPVRLYEKFVDDISSEKLKEDELILLKYIIESGRVKLGVGWQEQHEVAKIIVWEEVNEVHSKLSSNYNKAISKFEVRGYTEVSAVTGSNNPKEVKLKSEIADNILDLPEIALEKINKAFELNEVGGKDDDLPF